MRFQLKTKIIVYFISNKIVAMIHVHQQHVIMISLVKLSRASKNETSVDTSSQLAGPEDFLPW